MKILKNLLKNIRDAVFNLVSGKLSPRRLSPGKLIPEKIPPPRKLPHMKIPPMNIALMKAPPVKITPNEVPSPFTNHTNERKNKIIKFFCLEESCAMQHPYQNNQGSP